jgi:hypothetical protein
MEKFKQSIKKQHKQNTQSIKNELFEYVYNPDHIQKYMIEYKLSDDDEFKMRWTTL